MLANCNPLWLQAGDASLSIALSLISAGRSPFLNGSPRSECRMKKSLKFTRGKWVKCDSETTPTMAAQIAQLNRVVLHLGARITALEFDAQQSRPGRQAAALPFTEIRPTGLTIAGANCSPGLLTTR